MNGITIYSISAKFESVLKIVYTILFSLYRGRYMVVDCTKKNGVVLKWAGSTDGRIWLLTGLQKFLDPIKVLLFTRTAHTMQEYLPHVKDVTHAIINLITCNKS